MRSSDELRGGPELERQVRALGEWFHNFDFGGVRTAPDHFLGDYPGIVWQQLAGALPSDLTGKSVLDIGCNAGFFSIEMKRRGARRVVGIDSEPMYLEQAKLAARLSGVELELRQLSTYDLAELRERFDVVLFMGVLYHLRYPLLALDLIREHVAGDLLVFQSMLRGSDEIEPLADDHPFEERAVFDRPSYPRLHFVEQRYCGDDSNWWIPNRAGAEAMLRSAGFELIERPAWTEAYVCRVGQAAPARFRR